MFAMPLHPGLAEIKTLHPIEKLSVKDAGCAGKKRLVIWKLLHINSKTVEFMGWGIYCDPFLCAKKSKLCQLFI